MDKRKHARAFTASGAQLFDAEGKLICEVNINDISQGGIFAVSYEQDKFTQFSTGKEIKFKMKIPTGEIEGTAQIVWVSPSEAKMGLKFVNIDNEDGISNLLSFVANDFM